MLISTADARLLEQMIVYTWTVTILNLFNGLQTSKAWIVDSRDDECK